MKTPIYIYIVAGCALIFGIGFTLYSLFSKNSINNKPASSRQKFFKILLFVYLGLAVVIGSLEYFVFNFSFQEIITDWAFPTISLLVIILISYYNIDNNSDKKMSKKQDS